MHTPKCGGSSVEAALQNSGVNYINTKNINLDSKDNWYKRIVENNTYDWLVFGHTSDIRNGHDVESQNLRELLINRLHNSSKSIILPARHPVQLMRSWMHYNKTRANIYIENQLVNSEEELARIYSPIEKKKMTEYIKTMKKICGSNSIPREGFSLDPRDEEQNLIKYLKVIMQYKYLIPAYSHTLQLFYNKRYDIIDIIRSSKLLRLDINSQVISKRIIVYDVEKYTNACKEHLNDMISKEFTKYLILARENVSNDKTRIETNSLKRFERIYRAKFICEYDIYKHAL